MVTDSIQPHVEYGPNDHRKDGYIQKSRLFEFHILEQSKKVELLKKVDFFAQIQKSGLLLSKKVDLSQMSIKVDFFQQFKKVDILDLLRYMQKRLSAS